MPVHIVNGFTRDSENIPFGSKIVIKLDVDGMSVCESPLYLVKGNTKTIPFVVENSDGEIVDITGYKIWFTVKDPAWLDVDTDANIKFQLKNVTAGGADSEILITDGANGAGEIYIVPTNTQTIPDDTYSYDVKLGTPAGDLYTPIRGPFHLGYRVTAATT
jgi:hypothetical protein